MSQTTPSGENDNCTVPFGDGLGAALGDDGAADHAAGQDDQRAAARHHRAPGDPAEHVGGAAAPDVRSCAVPPDDTASVPPAPRTSSGQKVYGRNREAYRRHSDSSPS